MLATTIPAQLRLYDPMPETDYPTPFVTLPRPRYAIDEHNPLLRAASMPSRPYGKADRREVRDLLDAWKADGGHKGSCRDNTLRLIYGPAALYRGGEGAEAGDD